MHKPDESLEIYGTLEPSSRLRPLSAGSLSLAYGQDGIRSVTWKGVEVVRGIYVLLRDENWGTIPADETTEELQEAPEFCRLRRRYSYLGNALDATVELTAKSDGLLECTFELSAHNDVMLNRAGFSILHPVKGVAGHCVDVHHANGESRNLVFPDLISPAQPVFDIACLSHQIGQVKVSFEFQGEVFEMEDQRNWSDASFKTYCRPLGKPFPYRIGKGEVVRQAVRLRIADVAGGFLDDSGAPSRETSNQARARPVPDILIAAQGKWSHFQDQPASGYVLRLGYEHECSAEFLRSLAAMAQRVASYIDAELILGGSSSAPHQLAEIASLLQDAGIAPRHVIALPQAYLKSYQPNGAWPEGLTPDECTLLAKGAFPDAEIGAGSLTNFTELNRCRSSLGVGSFISHGNAAIVHAADDLSVLETLEALPFIFESGRSIAGDRAYRLGLVSIGMRGNPYGESLTENPENIRKTMTDDDPRQKGLFAAAYAIGVASKALVAGVDAITMAGLGGVFGTHDRKALHPIFHVVKALSGLSGRLAEPLTNAPASVYGFRFDGGLVLANCSPDPVVLKDMPPEYALLDAKEFDAASRDPDWLEKARKLRSGGRTLGPFACLFAGVGQ